MSYCLSYGASIPENDRHHPPCGTADTSPRVQSQKPNLIKCPNCGQELSSFQGNCPACGYEIRNVTTSEAIRRFSEQLSSIEKKASKSSSPEPSTTHASTAEEAALIRNYVVPNSREDLFEFMILAHSHVGESSPLKHKDVLLLDAWEAKIEQVYEKGRLVLPKSDFQQLTESYLVVKESLRAQQKRAYRQSNSRSIRGVFGVAVGIIVTLIATFDSINSESASLFEILSMLILCIALPIASDKSKSLLGIAFCCLAALVSYMCSRTLVQFGENGSWFFLQFLICFFISLFQFIRFLIKKPTKVE